MACWWRIYAETHGVTITPGASWKKIVAQHFNASATIKGSHPKRLVDLVTTAGSPGLSATGNGSHTKRLVDEDVPRREPSAARMLALYGGRAPMT
jgi:hypothetical protein